MAEFREYGTTRHPSGMAISRGMWCDGVARAEQSRTLAERGKRWGGHEVLCAVSRWHRAVAKGVHMESKATR